MNEIINNVIKIDKKRIIKIVFLIVFFAIIIFFYIPNRKFINNSAKNYNLLMGVNYDKSNIDNDEQTGSFIKTYTLNNLKSANSGNGRKIEVEYKNVLSTSLDDIDKIIDMLDSTLSYNVEYKFDFNRLR